MPTFNMACIRDTETGCVYGCVSSGEYEQCRQSYYLKQQNQILKQRSIPQGSQSIDDLTSTVTSAVEKDGLSTRVETLERNNLDLTNKLGEQHSFFQTFAWIGVTILIIGIFSALFLLRKFKLVKR